VILKSVSKHRNHMRASDALITHIFIINLYLLILLSLQQLNLIFPSTNPLLGLQQLYPKTLALNLHHICFSFLSLINVNIFQSKNLIDIIILIKKVKYLISDALITHIFIINYHLKALTSAPEALINISLNLFI